MRFWRSGIRTAVLAALLVALLASPVAALTRPSAPQKVKLAVAEDNVLTLTYEAPRKNGGARILDYRISVDDSVFNVGNRRSLNFGEVTPGKYQVSVSARNIHGWGPWKKSNPVNVKNQKAPVSTTTPPTTTPPVQQAGIQRDGEPTNVRSLRKSVRKDGTIRITWSKPAKGDVQGYWVRLKGKFDQRLGSSQTAIDIKGLGSGLYTFEVSAFNSAGESSRLKIQARVPEGIAATPTTTPDPEAEPDRRVGPFRSQDQFVERMYIDLFGRAADEVGLDYWSSRINSEGSNGPEIIDQMMATQEFQPSYQSIRLYLAYFNRLPDNAGLNYWIDVLKQGRGTLDGVSDAFAGSEEFINTYGSLNDQDFVALVYNNVLLRIPDQAGYEYWIRQLSRGLTRGQMMILFSDSAEFINSSNPAVQTVAIYNSLLDRSPSADEFQKWIAHIGADPADRLLLIRDIVDSSTYKKRLN